MDFPKRIILSRKGFDSRYGGIPSPIIEGKPISLPIPESHPTVVTRYSDLPSPVPEFPTYADILRALGSKIQGDHRVHLDPDISNSHHPGSTGWRPMFGQCEAAQGLLKNSGVAPGDLFLFFGWFRNAELQPGGGLRHFGDHMHVIHGWLQIKKTLDPKTQPPPYEPCGHPHFIAPDRKNNIVYLATKRLSFADFPGAGSFRKYDQALRLTDPGERNRRSYWRLPSFFYCDDPDRRLTYHGKRKWRNEPPYSYVCSAPIGQEFVLDLRNRTPEAHQWLMELLSCADVVE